MATIEFQGLAPGTTPLTFDLAQTSLTDENGNTLDLITANSGSLTVTPVPEPGTWALASLALGLVALRRRTATRTGHDNR